MIFPGLVNKGQCTVFLEIFNQTHCVAVVGLLKIGDNLHRFFSIAKRNHYALVVVRRVVDDILHHRKCYLSMFLQFLLVGVIGLCIKLIGEGTS